MKPYNPDDPGRDTQRIPTTPPTLTPATPTATPPDSATVPVPITQASPEAGAQANERIVVPLVEETLQVAKRPVQVGEVVIRKTLETGTQTVPVDLAYEEVEVERVPVNRALAEGEVAQPRQEGNTWIIPILEEEVVVTKHTVIREEMRVTKRLMTRQEEFSDTVVKQRLNVETTGNVQSLPGEGPQGA